MKWKGVSNIITDCDVTVTENTHLGDSLHTVVSEFDKRLQKLEEQEKWIYANGGIGGASGSGGGSTTRWQIKGSLDNIELSSGSTVSLTQGVGNYDLKIYTSGGSGVYSVTYTYGTRSGTISLSADNSWSATIPIRILENDRLSIVASDGNIRREITGVKYIVTPYQFNNLLLYRNDGSQYPTGNTDIFVEDAQNNGIHIRSSYSIAVNGVFTYKWFLDGVQITDETEISDSQGYVDYEIPSSFFTNENAALHSYQLQVSAKPDGILTPIIYNLTGDFNLIPKTLYLKISPASGQTIYDGEVENPYTFNTNNSITLTVRIYNGINATGNLGEVRWTVYNNDGTVGRSEYINLSDGVSRQITTFFTQPGWNSVKFEYSLNNVGTGTPVYKYFFCKESHSIYNWFNVHLPESRRFYIPQATSDEQKLFELYGIDSINIPLYLQKRSSDESETKIGISEYTNGNQFINFAIQYNDINNVKLPIIKLYSDDDCTQEAITIYQDHVDFGQRFFDSTQSCNIFLHKEKQYDPTDLLKYHMISINVASSFYLHEAEEGLINNTTYYEISVYIDGKLEGTVNAKSIVSPELHYIALQPGNYVINHIDISRFVDKTDGVRTIFDSDVNWYWNSYKSRINRPIEESETAILESLFDSEGNPTYSIVNDLVKVNEGLPNNVALNANCPTMVITCSRDISYGSGIRTIYDWMNSLYTDTTADNLGKVPINVQSIQWSNGKSELKDVEITNKNYFGQNTHFTLEIQGSSTRNNKSKNFTLGVESDESLIAQKETVLFSPNFVKDDKSTFLPERAFTLKSDVVDSSHTNNTAMGRFINENNKWGYKQMQNLEGDPNIINHVRQCLEGFSMVLFLNVVYKDGSNDKLDCYYLGIYNFNLGRDSYFNLGYCDLSQLDSDNFEVNGFTFCKVGGIKNGVTQKGMEPLDGFLAAEVQDNSPYWDFSQYDDSILFPLSEDETGGFMFGDIVYAPNIDDTYNSVIKDFVKSVASAGGYLFKLIGKEFVPAEEVDSNNHAVAYHYLNKVNSYTTQYKRSRNDTDVYHTPYTGDLPELLTETALSDCILDNIDEDKTAKLDYESLVYYYLTCMVFGLVDSVQKNLNIKTWSGGTDHCKTGLFFYDMDTCLGKTNSGGKTSYFTFSDFWKSEIIKYDANGDIIPEDDNITIPTRIVNNGITNYRDCFLWGTPVTGYDTPSSYLFAIAKYASLSNTIFSKYGTVYPQYIYANWRSRDGVLKNADNFIDTYFASNLSNIPECLINLNYRNKYIYDYAKHASSFSQASTSLHGTGIEETRDWLDGRLHILDAYFNINQTTVFINGLQERVHNVDVSGNDDIYLLGDIFSNSNAPIGRKSSLTFTINADDYAPLCVKLGSDYKWYLFEDSTVNYETNVLVTGVLQTTFGGSQLWRSIDSINSFIESRDKTDDAFVFKSKTIDTLVGDSGIQLGSWSISGPSLKSIKLNSPTYKGTLNINDDFYSLTEIDISNSAISLNMNGSGVTKLTAAGLRGSGVIRLINCNSLASVNLENSLIDECQIQPAWSSTLNFSNVLVKKLTLKTPEPGTLTINNNSTITNLSINNIETLNVDGCSNLSSLTCTEGTRNTLKYFKAINCPALKQLVIYSDVLETLDLHNCTALEEITIYGSDFSNLRILNLGSTLVKVINFADQNDKQTNGVFNFSRLTSLAKSTGATSYVNFQNDSNLVSIQFDTSSSVYLNYNFQGCSKLERLYGIIYINVSSCFYGCNLFSIHGANLNGLKWNNKLILKSSGQIQHPIDLGADPRTYKPTTAGLTSMFFNGNYANSAFSDTSCTIFDVYYMLWNCTPAITNINHIFRYPKNAEYGKFSWTTDADNSPDYRMFTNCTNVTSMSEAFRASGGIIRFKSPSHNDTSVTSNNGLFSPLINLTTWSYVFYGYTFVIDRFLFRRTDETSYKLSTVNRFLENAYIVDNVNNISRSSAVVINSNCGSLSGFFNNLTKISGVVRGMLLNVKALDFSTISNIPDGITSLISCFTTESGTGEVNFNNYFSSNTKLTSIYQSFKSTKTLLDSEAPYIELNNNTFEVFYPRSEYTGLTEIGYYIGSDTNYRTTNPLASSLSGIDKVLTNNQFPEEIFSRLDKLSKACAIFMDTKNHNIESLKLPGNLFKFNPELTDCSALFYNFKNPYTISPTHRIEYTRTKCNIIESDDTFANFTNCTKLSNVSYLFGATVQTDKDNEDYPALTGMIPNNLFWHGATVKTSTITGSDEREEILDEFDNPTGSYNYINEQTAQVTTITVNATISDISHCFQACDCDAYEKEESQLYFEYNPNYSPFTYLKSSNSVWSVNKSKNTQEYTAIWMYDGYNGFDTISSGNYENLDFVDWHELNGDNPRYIAYAAKWKQNNDEDVQPKETFLCAPDLLRYCTTKANISYLFAGSGMYGMNSYWQVANKFNQNKYAYGIEGRICPYLLKPVSSTTDVTQLFSQCKKISHIKDTQQNEDIVIPYEFFTYAKNITILDSMFAYFAHPNKVNYKPVFKELNNNNNLNIKRIFFNNYWCETGQTTNTLIEEVFRYNKISNLTESFRIAGESNTDSQPRDQRVTFKNIFKPNTYNKSMYETGSYAANFSRAFYGYHNYTVFENKTLMDTTVTNNYTRVVN